MIQIGFVRLLCLITAVYLLITINVFASGQNNVLVIHSWAQHLPWVSDVDSGLHSSLDKFDQDITVFHEYMDVNRFNSDGYEEFYADYIKSKYIDKDIHYVVSNNRAASNVVLRNSEFFISAKKIFIDFPANALSGIQDAISITIAANVKKFIYEVVRVSDPVKLLLILDTTDSLGMKRLRESKEAVKLLQIPHEFLIDVPLQEILDRVSKLQKKTAIAYLLTFKNEDGEFSSPRQNLLKIVKSANAPIYTHWKPLMGTGVVGGYMISGATSGEAAGRVIIESISGLPFKAPDKLSQGINIYDHELMSRWGILEALIPADSTLVNVKLSIFEEHGRELTVIIAIVVLGMALILLLIRFKLIRMANQKLQKMSLTDPLTGLVNRRGLELVVRKEMERFKRFKEPVSMLMIDIDHFKDVNDKFGHHTGDVLLKHISDQLTMCVREVDSVARWGGEEFLVLLVNTDCSGAMVSAEYIMDRLKRNTLEQVGLVTVSIGVAEFSGKETFETWYTRADKALYEAKASGRDRARKG